MPVGRISNRPQDRLDDYSHRRIQPLERVDLARVAKFTGRTIGPSSDKEPVPPHFSRVGNRVPGHLSGPLRNPGQQPPLPGPSRRRAALERSSWRVDLPPSVSRPENFRRSAIAHDPWPQDPPSRLLPPVVGRHSFRCNALSRPRLAFQPL